MNNALRTSSFYQPSPAGDDILLAAIDFASRCDVEDVTDRFLSTIPNDPGLAALYAGVPNRGNLHQEVGRQMRRARRAAAGRREGVVGRVHGSFTRLPRRWA